jgi:ferrochelatase
MRWVKSYAAHPAFVSAMQNCIRGFLKEKQLREEEVVLFFSPHGLPKKFICSGDVYQTECERSYRYISSAFPHALSIMAYQSKFGRGEWLRPYTNEVCEDVGSWGAGRKQVVFVPLSFTSDHVETLFEVEQQYLPVIRKKGFEAYRCPALNHRPDWLSAIPKILNEADFCNTQMLIAREMKRCCTSCNPTCCTCK